MLYGSWHDFSSKNLKILRKCAPRQCREHISERRFLPTSCAWRRFYAQSASKTIALGGSFPSCAVEKIIVFTDWTENGSSCKLCLASLVLPHAFWINLLYFRSWFCHFSLEALLHITCTFAYMLNLIFIFSLLFLPLLLGGLFNITCISHAFWMGFSYFRFRFCHLWNTFPILLRSIAAFTKQIPHDDCFQPSPIVNSMLFFAYPNSMSADQKSHLFDP